MVPGCDGSTAMASIAPAVVPFGGASLLTASAEGPVSGAGPSGLNTEPF